MKIHQRLSALIAFVAIPVASIVYAATPTITGVTAQQRYPWNGKVDILYTITGDIAEEAKQRAVFTSLKVSAIDVVANTTNTATQLSGDLSLAAGTHAIVWDMDAEGLPLPFKSSNIVFRVSCETTPATYCVIDLSAGSNASSYPVTYMAEPPSGGFNVDAYKTTKLVLKRIEAGTFIMGEDQTDESHRVTLTKSFFCGLFEMTQKQYELVTGVNPSYLNQRDKRAVNSVSYDMIRGISDGAQWPVSRAVDSDSFMGKFRARTGLEFDLPTEAQWEYACRAGTTTPFSFGTYGGDDYVWYKSTADGSEHDVGTKLPNGWGLYDMHGSVCELCLDWFGGSFGGNDPMGPSSGTSRVFRGGCRFNFLQDCMSCSRGNVSPSKGYEGRGFRLVRTLSNVGNEQIDVLCSGKSDMGAVDVESSIRTTTQTERICYSLAWVDGEDADAAAIVEVNGEMLNSAVGSGYVEWTPMSNGIYVLTHKVMSNDEQIGETLMATFIVESLKAANPVFSPESCTIFDTSLSVSISCLTEGAVIHYTTDGSEPSVNSAVYRRFRINGKTTVKAIAEKEGWIPSEVVTAEYALGQCADPVITPNDGATFEWGGEQVSISWQGEDGVLRYTTDGSDPTPTSPIYEGAFTINDSTVVKARAFGDQFFDSAVVTANIMRVWTDVATPQIEGTNSFTGSKARVVISCATEGATIRYTLDGSEPGSSSSVYTGPIYVTESCAIKAYATKDDYHDSAVAVYEIVKEWCIGDTMGSPDQEFTTDGSGGVGWMRVVDATAPNGEAMKSGAITHSQYSVLETKVMGSGTLTFSWRTSCEDSGGQYDWDHVEFAVDGTVRLQRDGINSWAEESVCIDGDGEHTVSWTYKKDDVESEGDDAAYVAGYGWTTEGGGVDYTVTTPEPVPYSYLDTECPTLLAEYGGDYEAAAKATAANGRRKVWECFVAGISPTNETASFTARIEMQDGVPVVTWKPDLNTNGVVRTYKVYGSETLENGGEWQYPINSLHRFFKVTVEMP